VSLPSDYRTSEDLNPLLLFARLSQEIFPHSLLAHDYLLHRQHVGLRPGDDIPVQAHFVSLVADVYPGRELRELQRSSMGERRSQHLARHFNRDSTAPRTQIIAAKQDEKVWCLRYV